MASIVVRNLPDDVHRALRIRAAQNGRSTEAEVRDILANAVKPKDRLKIGTALAAIGKKYKVELEVVRDRTPGRIVTFE